MSMDVLWATDCAAATVAWRSGIGSALYVTLLVIFMIATAPAYDPRVRRAYTVRTRRTVQWTLRLAPALLLLFWIGSISRFGWSDVGCYVRNLSLGMVLFLGPILAAIIFVTARLIGAASAR
jgi:hypothetical protein